MRRSSPRPTAATPTGRPTSAAQPAKMLAFTGVKPGMKVLDMEANAGYSTELLARAVAPGGMVYAQDSAAVMERRQGQVRHPRPETRDEECRACRPEFRRSDSARCQQSRPDHVLLRLSRHDLYAGRPRQDEPEDVRGAEARRLSRHRRSFRRSRATAPRSARRCTGSRRARCARRSRRPASSSSPRPISCVNPKIRATPRCSSRSAVDEFVLKYQKPM